LKRRKLYLLIPILLLTPAVCFYALRLPEKFRAQALVGAEPLIPGQAPSTARFDPAVVSAQEQMRAVRDMLLSPPVLDEVSREFHLAPSPRSGRSGDAKDDLRSKIQIQLDGPEAFYVGFEGPDPKQAMDVSNRLANLFVERTSALRGQQIEQHDSALDQEVERTRQQLEAQENGLRSFKDRVSQVLPDRLATNLKEMETRQQGIEAKSGQITEAEARRSSIIEEMKALEKQGVLLDDPPAKTPSQIALDDLRLKLSQLRARYTPEYPEIQRTELEIRDMEAAAPPAAAPSHQPTPAQMRYIALQSELKSIDPRLNTYRQERDVLTAQMEEFERRVSSTPGFETALSERTQDATMLRARYETLFAKQQEAKLSQRTNPTDNGLVYRILEPATLPAAPYSPHADRIILFGLLAALGIGVMGVLAAERLDTTFETSEQIETLTTIPVLSTVPSIPQKLSGKKIGASTRWSAGADAEELTAERLQGFQKHRLIMLSDPQSVGSQQYRILALKVSRWMEKTGGRTLLVTSAAGEEGKSLTALNLSLALAATLQGGVLLIDSDLRLPQVQQRLGLKVEEGFSELLSGTGRDLGAYISTVGNLDVICGGRKTANPAGLLASQRARDVLAQLREEYQVVVIDGPPLVPIADSHILAGLADSVMLVVRARQTSVELFHRAVESLGEANMTVVLNDVDYSATPYAHAYQYHQ
jgi:polysaccharide chain length determinant protein (PEP-CTERM system associated)